MAVIAPPPPAASSEITVPRCAFEYHFTESLVALEMQDTARARVSGLAPHLTATVLLHLQEWGCAVGRSLSDASDRIGLPDKPRRTRLPGSVGTHSQQVVLSVLGQSYADNSVLCGRGMGGCGGSIAWALARGELHVLTDAADRLTQYERISYAIAHSAALSQVTLPPLPPGIPIIQALGYVYAFLQVLPAVGPTEPHAARSLLEAGIRKVEGIAATTRAEFSNARLLLAGGAWVCWRGRKGEALVLAPSGVVYRGTLREAERDLLGYSSEDLDKWTAGGARRMRVE